MLILSKVLGSVAAWSRSPRLEGLVPRRCAFCEAGAVPHRCRATRSSRELVESGEHPSAGLLHGRECITRVPKPPCLGAAASETPNKTPIKTPELGQNSARNQLRSSRKTNKQGQRQPLNPRVSKGAAADNPMKPTHPRFDERPPAWSSPGSPPFTALTTDSVSLSTGESTGGGWGFKERSQCRGSLRPSCRSV